MTGAVFFETLRRSWRQIIYWGIGLGLYALYPFVLLPESSDGLDGMVELMEMFDSTMLAAVGLTDVAMMATPEGIVGYTINFALLVTAVFAVIAGLNVTSAEEDAGILDVLLSWPLPRWQVVVEKSLAYSAMMVGIGLCMGLGMLLGKQIAPIEVDLSNGVLMGAALSLIPPTLVIMAFTVLVATIVRRRAVASAIAGVAVVVSFMMEAVANAVGSSAAESISRLSIFSYYDAFEALANGLDVVIALALLALMAAMVAAATVFFERRDLAV